MGKPRDEVARTSRQRSLVSLDAHSARYVDITLLLSRIVIIDHAMLLIVSPMCPVRDIVLRIVQYVLLCSLVALGGQFRVSRRGSVRRREGGEREVLRRAQVGTNAGRALEG